MATARDGLRLMVQHLRRAAALDPSLDRAGPERVLAILLLRAPGWPLGPGDPEAALPEARRAAERFPDHPPNQLALAEALAAAGDVEGSRASAERGLTLAQASAASGDPDATEWVVEAQRVLAAASHAAASR
jgi:hypothetical protein